jgi:hypothetical protein
LLRSRVGRAEQQAAKWGAYPGKLMRRLRNVAWSTRASRIGRYRCNYTWRPPQVTFN